MELARLLAADLPDLKVVVMSGYPDDVVERLGLPERPRNFIQKPLTARDLARRVREVLDG
jgi:DNA-binding NarL/FixJ family response regulator